MGTSHPSVSLVMWGMWGTVGSFVSWQGAMAVNLGSPREHIRTMQCCQKFQFLNIFSYFSSRVRLVVSWNSLCGTFLICWRCHRSCWLHCLPDELAIPWPILLAGIRAISFPSDGSKWWEIPCRVEWEWNSRRHGFNFHHLNLNLIFWLWNHCLTLESLHGSLMTKYVSPVANWEAREVHK